MLVTLGEIHQIVFFLHYDQDAERVSRAIDEVRDATRSLKVESLADALRLITG